MNIKRKINKVLLIYPFTVIDDVNVYGVTKDLSGNIIKGDKIEPSLGLSYIMSYFKKIHPNIKIDVFDANSMAIKWCVENNKIDIPHLWQMLKSEIEKYNPDLVGITCFSIVIAVSVKKVATLVKEINPTIYTVIGGNYAQNTYDESLRENSIIDFVVFSEGEIVFANLIKGLNEEEDLKSIRGIAYLNGRDIVRTEKEELIRNLDDLPDCDRTSIDISFYSKQRHYFIYRFLDKSTTKVAPILAARGCHHNCAFCTARLIWGNKLRYRDPKNVVDEMLYLKENYDINTFNFYDANIIGDGKSFLALANEIIKRIPNINWMSIEGMQVSTLMNEEVVDAIYESGCKWFILPYESGNEKSLKRIGKMHSVNDIGNVIEFIRKWDDSWISGNVITGFPWENKDDIENTIKFSKSLDFDWLYVYRFIPFPGTDIYEECFQKGYVHKYSWDVKNIGKLFTLNTPEFDSKYIAERNYAMNAEYNFFKNRNIKLRPEQAIRDFNYVLEVSYDNALAMWGKGAAYEELANYSKALKWYKMALDVLEKEKELIKEKEINKNKDSTTMKSISMSFVAIMGDTKYLKYFIDANIDVKKSIAGVKNKINLKLKK